MILDHMISSHLTPYHRVTRDSDDANDPASLETIVPLVNLEEAKDLREKQKPKLSS